MKKWLKILIIVVSSIILLLLVAAIIASPIAKHYIETHDKEIIGREITMDKLKVNIFTGSLKIKDFILYEQNSKDKFVSFDTLDTKIHLLKLLDSKVDIDHIYLKGLNANVWQKDSIFNFTDIINHFSSDTVKKDEDTSSSSWKVILNDIQISRSNLSYRDLIVGSTFRVKDLALNIPIIDLSNTKSDVVLNLNFASGGSLSAKVNWNPNADKYAINLQLRNFATNVVLPYLQESLNVKDMEGRLWTDINIKGKTNHIMDLNAFGKINLKDFKLIDSKDRNVVSFDDLNANIADVGLNNYDFHLHSLTISGLKSMFEMYKDGNNNFSDLVKNLSPAKSQAATTNANTSSPSSKPINLKIDKLKINISDFAFNDYTILEPFKYNITDINTESNNFNLNGLNKIRMSASVGKGDVGVMYDGSFSSLSNMNLIFTLKGLNLKDFSPYVKDMFACSVTDGTLSLKSQIKITNNMLKGVNDLDLYNPKVGKKDKSLKREYQNIPLKLGIYILTDKNHKAVLNLPISGNIASPEFSYKKLIIKTLCNLLVKVATAPVSALGNVLGIKDDNMNELVLTSYQRDFTSQQYAFLANVAKIQKEKSKMVLCFNQRIEYDKAIEDISINQLRKNYYAYEKGIEDKQRLDLISRDDLKNVDEDSKDVQEFLNNELKKQNLSTDGSVKERAKRLYGLHAGEKLTEYCDIRNKRLIKYFVEKEGIAENHIKVVTQTIEEMKQSNKTAYEISFSMEGEE